MQAAAGQIHQESLELAECFPSFEGLLGVLHRFEGAHALDENKRPPVLSARGAVESLAVARGDYRQGSARSIARVLLLQLAPEVGSHALEIVHQAHGILEDLMVDPLMDVAN